MIDSKGVYYPYYFNLYDFKNTKVFHKFFSSYHYAFLFYSKIKHSKKIILLDTNFVLKYWGGYMFIFYFIFLIVLLIFVFVLASIVFALYYFLAKTSFDFWLYVLKKFIRKGWLYE